MQAQDSSGLQSIGEIVVFVIDVNEPPKFEDHMFLVPEIRNSEFDIIGSIVCEDPDKYERHTWGIDSVIFSLISQTGTNVIPNAFLFSPITSQSSSANNVRTLDKSFWEGGAHSGIDTRNKIDIRFTRAIWIGKISIHFYNNFAASDYVIDQWVEISDNNVKGTIHRAYDKVCSADRLDSHDFAKFGIFADGVTITFTKLCSMNDNMGKVKIKYIEIFENEIFQLSGKDGVVTEATKSVELQLRQKRFPWDPPPAILDYESTQLYTIEISVVDGFGFGLSTSANAVIKIQNNNEKPSLLEDTTKFPFETDHVRLVSEAALVSQKWEIRYCHSIQTCLVESNCCTVLLQQPEYFRIDGCSGQIRVAKAELNFEETREFTIDVAVTDTSGAVSDGEVTVLIEDVNEAPFFLTPLISKSVDETAWHTRAGKIKSEGGIEHVFGGLLCLNLSDSAIQFTANQVFKIEDTENSLLNIVSKIQPFPRPLPLWFCFQTKYQSLATGVVSRGGFVSTHESGSGVGDVVVDLSDSSHAKDPDNDDISPTRRQQMTYEIQSGDSDHVFLLQPRTGQFLVNSWLLDRESKSEYHITISIRDDGLNYKWINVKEKAKAIDATVQIVSISSGVT